MYVHARRLDDEWFWQALGLAVPFSLLGIGASADKTPRDGFWNTL